MMTYPYTTAVAATSGCSCGCGGGLPCPPGHGSGNERTNYFAGQLVTADDLTQDQLYFRDKHLRHNRLLHGWGVVCGARVMEHASDPCKVVVEAGYILGPWGHEIVIEHDIEVDLCHEDIEGNAVSPCGSGADPWCSDIRVNRPSGRPLYLAVKYDECSSRPVHVHGHACGCGSAACEYSRVRDGFSIKLLADLPGGYSHPMPQPNIDNTVHCALDATGKVVARACTPCPPEPWVVLADIILAEDGSIKDIECFAHRRYVVSFADYYFLCQPRQAPGLDYRRDILVDLRAAVAAQPEQPRMMIALRRVEGRSVYLPVHFEVQAGDTIGSLLAREGSREFRDEETNETFTLADLYALAGTDPATPAPDLLAAVAPLQDVPLRLTELREVRGRIGEILDATGRQRLTQEHGDAPAAVARIAATNIRGVSPESTLGRKLTSLSVGDVAGLGRDQFLARMAEGVPEAERAALTRQAGSVWDAASEATRLGESLRRG